MKALQYKLPCIILHPRTATSLGRRVPFRRFHALRLGGGSLAGAVACCARAGAGTCNWTVDVAMLAAARTLSLTSVSRRPLSGRGRGAGCGRCDCWLCCCDVPSPLRGGWSQSACAPPRLATILAGEEGPAWSGAGGGGVAVMLHAFACCGGEAAVSSLGLRITEATTGARFAISATHFASKACSPPLPSRAAQTFGWMPADGL